jgi:hypothetical protein
MLLFVLATGSLFAKRPVATARVSNTTQSAISKAISSVCNGSIAGTVLFPNGTYSVTSGFHVPSNCTLQAQHPGYATLNVTNNDYGIYLDGDNITISGFVLNGGGIVVTNSSQSIPTSNVTITHNIFQNIVSGKNGITTNGVWAKFNISYNKLSFIGNLDWAGVTSSTFIEGCNPQSKCPGSGGGISNNAGMDQSVIEHNTFDHILADGVHLTFNYSSSPPGYGTYRAANNNSVSYNVMTNIHRMGLELQGGTGCFNPPCVRNLITNMKVAGNFNYDQYQPYYDSMLFSFVLDGSVNTQYLNNTMIYGVGGKICNGAGSYSYENTGDNSLHQGNVIASVSGCPNRPAYSVVGSVGGGTTLIHQNMLLCGVPHNGKYFEFEGPGTKQGGCSTCGEVIDRYNYIAAACPNANAPETTTLAVAFSSSNGQLLPGEATHTWNVYATDEISVVNVQFFLDGSTTPVVTQERQDLNTNFSSDRKWLYHATIATSPMKTGAHTISAVATDVSGATQTVSQTFQVGEVSTTRATSGPLTNHSGTPGRQ